MIQVKDIYQLKKDVKALQDSVPEIPEVDLTSYYTKSETDNKISTEIAELVDSAPETLNTLNELSEALGNDPNFATTVATNIGNKADKSHKHDEYATRQEVENAMITDWGTIDVLTTTNCPGYPPIPYDATIENYVIYKADSNTIRLFQFQTSKSHLHYNGTFSMEGQIERFYHRILELDKINNVWKEIFAKQLHVGVSTPIDTTIPIERAFLKIYKATLRSNDSCDPSSKILIEPDTARKNYEISLRKGSDVSNKTYIGKSGEVIINSTKNILHVHDGTTPGGHALAKENHKHSYDDIEGVPNIPEVDTSNLITKAEFEAYREEVNGVIASLVQYIQNYNIKDVSVVSEGVE